MAMGEVLNLNNVKSLYVMAPNYAAGKNMVAGVTRTFKGKIVGKDLTKWGKDAQLDFSAELAKAKADADLQVQPNADTGEIPLRVGVAQALLDKGKKKNG